MLRVLLLSVAVVVCVGTQCLDSCSTNDDCKPAAPCSYCMSGKCGAGCAQKCTANSQCLDSNCKQCNNNTCGAGGGGGNVQCGGFCRTNTECDQSTNCKYCMQNKCGAGCAQQCKADSECLDSNCLSCKDGKCAGGGGGGGNASCGGSCVVNTDCAQQSNCQLCILGKCGAGCQMGCEKDGDCGDPNCLKCTNGECNSGGGGGGNQPCGGSCLLNTDCKQGGACSYCLLGHCGSGCGQKCTQNSNCLDPNCQSCNGTMCTSGGGGGGTVPCGGKCEVNTECIQEGPCKLCMAGVCGAGCGMPCQKSDNCLDSNCKSCKHVDGSDLPLCGAGGGSGNKTCGDTCAVNQDCTASPQNCGFCISGKCGNGCAQFCKADSDCLDANCPACNSGKCGQKK